jgi:hypothetical protein
MNDDFRCEENAALIGFLYDDCDADEQARITAHLAVCATCAGEIAALSATREHLSAWTPPDAQLGFRMNQGDDRASAAAWWSRPMPAWAQLAAAVVIFSAGTAVGIGTAGRVSPSGVDQFGAASTRAELSRLAEKVKQIEARPTGPITRVVVGDASRDVALSRVAWGDASRDVPLSRVIQLLEAQEQRQNLQLAKVITPLVAGQSKLEKDFGQLKAENSQGFGLVAFGKPQARGASD